LVIVDTVFDRSTDYGTTKLIVAMRSRNTEQPLLCKQLKQI